MSSGYILTNVLIATLIPTITIVILLRVMSGDEEDSLQHMELTRGAS